VLSAARRVLAQPSGTLVCHGAVAALAELMHLGVPTAACAVCEAWSVVSLMAWWLVGSEVLQVFGLGLRKCCTHASI
jgi:hypothetical protein